MTEDFWDESATTLIGLSLIIGFISSILILGWQAFVWLKSGTWIELPLLKIIKYLEIDTNSIYNPTEWYGAASMMQWILDLPISLCFPVFLFIIALLWKSFISLGK